VRKIALAAVAFVLAAALMAITASADPGFTLSAKKKAVKTRQQGQIACTVADCHRVPPIAIPRWATPGTAFRPASTSWFVAADDKSGRAARFRA
jgi:hypothetical protein